MSNLGDILQRWKEYGTSLYQTTNAWNPDRMEEPVVQRGEVEEAIKLLPNNKAAGADGIPAELFKSGCDTILVFCNLILKTGDWPKEWTQFSFIPIPKVLRTRKCDDHRTNSLLSHGS